MRTDDAWCSCKSKLLKRDEKERKKESFLKPTKVHIRKLHQEHDQDHIMKIYSPPIGKLND